ncbi:hypothetical protein S140_114 [Shewanella sp. phage 1/40]|uniref:hypothetical protein n=1 Tax=Shewanella sp. phage 1/40 TaxID=1458860 RepID=UPI0004F6EB3C|nr:hypothetical protein S140_114 [Shewanella sp. phage 1/40]AHK11521.1 hypothetical protein S140_114 [Shewanella sp. phage 1/40]
MKEQYKHISGYFPFWEYMKSQHHAIDLNKTLELPRTWFATIDGTIYQTEGFVDLLQKLNELYGEVYAPLLSTSMKSQFTIFFKQEDAPVQESASLIQLSSEKVGEEVKQEAPEQPVVESVEESDVVVAKTREDFPEIDWVRLDSLKSNKDDKGYLEKVAIPFGSDLKKNKSIGSMLADFEAHLGIK